MKEYAKELFELPLELTELVEQQTSIVQNAISTGIFIGNNSKDAIVTNIDKSVDLVKNVRIITTTFRILRCFLSLIDKSNSDSLCSISIKRMISKTEK